MSTALDEHIKRLEPENAASRRSLDSRFAKFAVALRRLPSRPQS